MHLLTSGDNQHRRNHLTIGRYMLLKFGRYLLLGEKVSLAYLAGMERLLPWQAGNCAITEPYESSLTSHLPQMLFEALHSNASVNSKPDHPPGRHPGIRTF